ncbi:hypothetical protein Aca07nite_88150 [Actinoplanes capillaceus]|uniref:Sporulation and spore germination n=1 Tax=Actinoplanes campanulatus TaxID=113559 RepID=A0ABQ3WZG8_9ACTN|nr:hypothetical protein [Actinoplanes capillaceus]GID51540.1 hypothetical protein Aca07nite_88150 [Actinoplanes capillaceus]
MTVAISFAVATPAEAETPAEAPQPTSLTATSTISALTAAKQSGQRVGITEATSETAEFFATPDGRIAGVISASPVRYREGDRWVPIDLTLRRDADGTIEPVAHPDGLRISGARSAAFGELASLGEDAKRVAMGWKGALPEPKLEGNKATYVEVLPGVDLVIEATASGFEQFAVVESAEAAARYVKEISLALTGPGVAQASQDRQGRVRIRDEHGRQVADMPTPLMWDAAAENGRGAPIRQRVALDVTAEQVAGDNDLVTLYLKPDQDWLKGAEYPGNDRSPNRPIHGRW